VRGARDGVGRNDEINEQQITLGEGESFPPAAFTADSPGRRER